MGVSAEQIKKVKGQGFLYNRGSDGLFSCRVITGNGVLTSEEMAWVCEAAERYGAGKVAMTTRLTVELPGVPFDNIEPLREFLAQKGLVTGGTGAKVRPVTACKGTTCVFGNADTQGLAQEIHERFYVGYGNVKLPHKFKIAVGGCPNNCMKPDLNDVGIVGVNAPQFIAEECKGCKKCAVEDTCPMHAAKVVDGKLSIDHAICNSCGRCVDKCYFKAMGKGEKGFVIYLGGRWGKQIQRGIPLPTPYRQEELFDVVEMALLLFCEQGKPGERFASMVERLGIEYFEKEFASKEVLKRKEQIIQEHPLA